VVEAQIPILEDLDAVLRRADVLCSGAEAHGMLCGFHCAGRVPALEVWQAEMLGERDTGDLSVRRIQALLRELWWYTDEQFAQDDLSFEPLLPPDSMPVDSRATALGGWCQGFLYGLGTSGCGDAGRDDSDVRDMLADLQRIASIEPDPQEVDEEGENAYVQLVEYVRVGVLLIREYLTHS
jgi:uncharacterized protein YgfB (UPF0149 family)